ncbi:MAG: hypothetical protein M3R72_03830 [Bacteroidota bacterium]|nr:hypothetical protein [Bacteroidota bacterium]
MKVVIAILLTALLGFALPLYLWWWSFVFASFFVAYVMKQNPLPSFGAGFIAIALLWTIQAAVIDARNNHLLSHKVALLLPFNGSVAALLVTTAIIGGLVSGMAALTASYLVKR